MQAVKNELTKRPCDLPPSFDIEAYRIFHGEVQKILHDGDRLELGGRELSVIHTPGHSPGHCCFYESQKGYLYSGDLIYSGCLYAFYPTTDPQLFYQSVKRIQRYPITRLLPARHDINIPVSLIDEIEAGFSRLDKNGQLRQGSGHFSFRNFQVKI